MDFFTVPTATFRVLYVFFGIGHRRREVAWSMGIEPIRTAFRSPWQNGVAVRFVATVRRELLDHVIILNERHLRTLLSEFVAY